MAPESLKYLIVITLSACITLAGFTLQAQAQPTMDPPHDPQGCISCHDMRAFDQPALIPGGSETVFNLVCLSCHNGIIVSPAVVTHSSDTTSTKYGTWSVGCSVCHNQHTQENPVGGGFVRSSINLGKITITPSKNGSRSVDYTGTASMADGDGTYNGICEVCHTQTTHFKNDGSGIDQLHTNMGAVAGTNCLVCHNHAEGFIGSGHNATHFRWDGGCETCHGAGAGTENIVAFIHGNACDLCHTTGGPYDATSNKVGDRGLGDATLAEGDAGTWTSSCLTCHNKTDVPGFHGLTMTDVAPLHNYLGSSRGSWADSGGTIPSTRAAGYSGKIDTANALIDDDYNCADCHDVQHTGFTPLEALEVHLFESGRGNGNCATCHSASMVADEITAGLGGTTIECEDCHSLANGNGPSGKVMYQYDGARHHKTVHAQAGNCTRCHGDPRPADLSGEPGHAGTAAINDGVIDNDGVTWDDGFDDDFGLNYIHPGGMPQQMGCRLCHTNYQTYTVDVKASGNANWTTDEDVDVHGYNINGPANGLTVYADNFDGREVSRGTPLTYLDRDNDLGVLEDAFKIQGMGQVTQLSIPSHRIDAIDGSSKIEVLNYGACLSCHTVQIRHASPIPDEDYDTPIYGTTVAARNTHPYDTLRYTPGRHVFNDLRGPGDPTLPSWENHTKNWGWMFGDDWDGRGRKVFWQTTWDEIYFDNVGNYSPNSLATIPVNVNINKFEGYPGTATYTIREFDTGPALPDIDDITITVAQWTGSTIYVEATSSLGSSQNFSFTYTGAGGPCNTLMTWDTDHYEGTCLAASGWTVSDTVTVSNDTTAASDSRTSPVTNLTYDPVTPVLASITLSDSNDADPTPAEAGFTNSHLVTVTMSASNYPTHVMFSEDAGFLTNTGWLLYDPFTSYTFADLGPPPAGEGNRTLYAKVKNVAGESGSQSASIILDTVDPAVPNTTLTAPNGHVNGWQAEFWEVGSSQTITWNAGSITDVNLKANPIFLKESFDSGTTWETSHIAQNEANDGSFGWTIPGPPIATAMIRLDVRDKAGNMAGDASDYDYSKNPPPQYIVTNTSDALVPGSLRQVMTDLLGAGGNNSIWFNIPDTDPNIVDGVAIISPATDLPSITMNNIFIEGATQAALRGNTNSRGPEVRIHKTGTSTTGFTISGGASTQINDLQITGFTTGVSSSGTDTVLEGNHFGFSSGNTAGYTSVPNDTGALVSGDTPAIDQNFFGCASTTGLDLTNSNSAFVDGNVFGVFPDPTDPASPASPADKCPVYGTYAIHVGGNADGAAISNNIISGSSYGISIGGPAGGTAETTSNTSITGNQIGTFYDNDDGWVTTRSPGTAVYVATSGGGNVIGGTSVATADDTLNDSNVISPYDPDNFFSYRTGIYIWDALDYTTRILGNFIGTNPECDPVNDRGACEVFTGTMGIHIYYSEGVTIGGDPDSEPPCQGGNVIANMSGNGASSYGVRIALPPSRYAKLNCNTFFDNGDGVSDDAFYQNYATPTPTRPVIVAADTNTVRVSNIWGGNGTTQQGNIVEVYLSDYDGAEYGEGVKLIGLTQAEFGQTTIDIDISGSGVSAGDWVTATRTWHYSGTRYQTSPFSTNLKITGTTTAPSLDWVGAGNYVGDGVHPDSAPVENNFTFQVKYTDADDDPPQIIELWLDEDDDGSYEDYEKFAMTEVDPGDTDYTDGKLYEITLFLDTWTGWAGDGVLNYRFYATDGTFYPVTGAPTYPLLDNTNTVTVTY